jgi:hypothetical protein
VVIHRDLLAGPHARPRTPASTWIHAWLRQRELDRYLAEGANPTTDALRALRARQLAGRRHRRALAAGLRGLVAEACDPPLLRRSPVPPLNREAVHAARDPLLRLARRLVQAENPCPRAVALASYLVCDPDSPAYTAATGASVADLAETALTVIDHQPLR